MDEVLAVANDAVEAIYQAQLAYFTERDFKVFSEKNLAASAFSATPRSLPLYKTRGEESEAFFEKRKNKKKAKGLLKRTVLMITKHPNETHGDVYAAICSDDSRALGDPNYFTRVYVLAKVEDSFKIVSIYTTTTTNDVVTFDYGMGADFGTLPAHTEALKVTAPTDVDGHIAFYNKG